MPTERLRWRPMPWCAFLTALLVVGCHSGRSIEEPHRNHATYDSFFFGVDLVIPPIPSINYEVPNDLRPQYEDQLATARQNWVQDPDNEDVIIWYGRRLAYLALYEEAIRVYTEGLRIHPDSYRLLRHRGHRFLTVGLLDRSVRDLSRAGKLVQFKPDEIEPDGQPNKRNTPRSTTQFNVWYHLALAQYLQGAYGRANDTYRQCAHSSINDDLRVATTYWRYLTLQRLDRPNDAASLLDDITEDMDIIENQPYHNLLLLFKGEKTLEEVAPKQWDDSMPHATLGYGVANWYVLNGRANDAKELMEFIISHPTAAAFGHIAAKTDLRRLNFDASSH